MLREILIGVDLGTSSIKVVAFDRAGRALASAARPCALSQPRPNWSEQDPSAWWRAATQAMKAVSRRIDPRRVAGISFSGQMHGSVFLDARGEVIRPCLLWNDGRTAPQCEEIIRTVGREPLLRVLRNLPLTSFTLPKLLWLKQNEKANYRRLRTLLLPKDYLRYRLTGRAAMDESDAAGTVMKVIGERRWAGEILAQLGLNAAVLPPLIGSAEIAGELTPAAARATGLVAGTPVIAGGGDQPVGAVGVGVFVEGQAMVSLGTSGVVLAPTRAVHLGGEHGLASFDHAVAGSRYLMGCVISAAGSLQWFGDALCQAEAAEAKKARRNLFDLLLERAAQTPAGAEDLWFLPYLMGERTPHPDPNARGVFFGLSTRHQKAHLTRALIEGVNFALRDSLELMRARGLAINDIRVTGGGARNPFWLQNLADILGQPVRPVENPEGGAMGAALLAGVGAGLYKDFNEAARRAIRVGDRVRPRRRDVRDYEQRYQRYRRLYPALKDLFVQYS